MTGETVAVKAAPVAPAGTVTDAGTTTAELLLASVAVIPPVGAAAVSSAVQVTLAAPVIELAVQLSALSAEAANACEPADTNNKRTPATQAARNAPELRVRPRLEENEERTTDATFWYPAFCLDT